MTGEKSCQTSFNLRLLYLYVFQLLNYDSLGNSGRCHDANAEIQRWYSETRTTVPLSNFALLHHLAQQGSPPIRDGVKLTKRSMGLVHGNHTQNSRAAWFFCKAVTSAGRCPGRPCVITRLLCWHKRLKLPNCHPLPELGGNKPKRGLEATRPVTKFSCWLAEWVVFWHSQAVRRRCIPS